MKQLGNSMKNALLSVVLITLTSVVHAINIEMPIQAQRVLGPYVSVIPNTIDRHQIVLDGAADEAETKTVIQGINGTNSIARVAVYVIGDGVTFYYDEVEIPPGGERFLLPFDYFDHDQVVGETIVVVSRTPIIVTGMMQRYADVVRFGNDEAFSAAVGQNRLMDVRQFYCSDREDLRMVRWFCENLPPPSTYAAPIPQGQ